jgi:hypothetical protein
MRYRPEPVQPARLPEPYGQETAPLRCVARIQGPPRTADVGRGARSEPSSPCGGRWKRARWKVEALEPSAACRSGGGRGDARWEQWRSPKAEEVLQASPCCPEQ